MSDGMKPISQDILDFLQAAVAEESNQPYDGPCPDWSDEIGSELVRLGVAVPTIIEIKVEQAKIILAKNRLAKIKRTSEGYAASVMDAYGQEPKGQLWEDLELVLGAQ